MFVISWDEWVVEPRILKWNETNLQKQKELQMLHPELVLFVYTYMYMCRYIHGNACAS